MSMIDTHQPCLSQGYGRQARMVIAKMYFGTRKYVMRLDSYRDR